MVLVTRSSTVSSDVAVFNTLFVTSLAVGTVVATFGIVWIKNNTTDAAAETSLVVVFVHPPNTCDVGKLDLVLAVCTCLQVLDTLFWTIVPVVMNNKVVAIETTAAVFACETFNMEIVATVEDVST